MCLTPSCAPPRRGCRRGLPAARALRAARAAAARAPAPTPAAEGTRWATGCTAAPSPATARSGDRLLCLFYMGCPSFCKHLGQGEVRLTDVELELSYYMTPTSSASPQRDTIAGAAEVARQETGRPCEGWHLKRIIDLDACATLQPQCDALDGERSRWRKAVMEAYNPWVRKTGHVRPEATSTADDLRAHDLARTHGRSVRPSRGLYDG